MNNIHHMSVSSNVYRQAWLEVFRYSKIMMMDYTLSMYKLQHNS